MHIFARVFCLQKDGNSAEEYEDACWPKHGADQVAQEFRFAVADGASESSFPGIWAKLLVRGFCSRRFHYSNLADGLALLQKRWAQVAQRKPLPWYAEELFQRGSFSTLLGLTLKQSDRTDVNCGSWHCIAVGDSCLFHVRRSELLRAFPKTKSEEFNNRPYLLSSNQANNGEIAEHIHQLGDDWQHEDSFLLMTDALACWFLGRVERGEKPWELISGLDTRDEKKPFNHLIAELRSAKELRNDDVTLVRITLD